MRDENEDREERERSADDAAGHPKYAFVQRGAGGFERDEDAGDKCGVNSEPIDSHIEKITEHRRERDFEREPDMGRVRERVRHEQALGKRPGRARRLGQKKQVQDHGQGNAIRYRYPNPEHDTNELFR